jgi:effector-binding domain-containing protein
MRFLKALFVLVLVLAAAVVAIAFVLPDSAHVERTILVERPASQVFAVLDSFRRYNEWSPWTARDPHAQYTISGPASGVGARQSWRGDPRTVGSGSQQIIQSTPDSAVTMALDFGGRGAATAHFLLQPQDRGTRVTWALDTTAPLRLDGNFLDNLIGRYIGLFMDRMVGSDFETGLRQLKTLVETFPNVDISGVSGEPVELAPRKIYFISASSGADVESSRPVLREVYAKLGRYVTDNGLELQGPPLSITTDYDASGWKFDAALPVDRNDIPTRDDIQAGATYSGPALQFMHVGAYAGLGDLITRTYAWATVQGYKPRDRLIEEYLNDAATTPPAQLQTRVTSPVE